MREFVTVFKSHGRAAKSIRLFLLVCMTVLAFCVPAAASAKIKKVSSEGKREVDVHFSGKVQYKNVKVCVSDASGNKMSTKIIERDNSSLSFIIKKAVMGNTYCFTISGIRAKGEKQYSCVSGKIYIPIQKGSVPVESIGYDDKDRELEFEFETRVRWKNPKVVITDGKKEYQSKITERDRMELELKVKKLKKGKIYRYKISGICKYGDESFGTITGTFMA